MQHAVGPPFFDSSFPLIPRPKLSPPGQAFCFFARRSLSFLLPFSLFFPLLVPKRFFLYPPPRKNRLPFLDPSGKQFLLSALKYLPVLCERSFSRPTILHLPIRIVAFFSPQLFFGCLSPSFFSPAFSTGSTWKSSLPTYGSLAGFPAPGFETFFPFPFQVMSFFSFIENRNPPSFTTVPFFPLNFAFHRRPDHLKCPPPKYPPLTCIPFFQKCPSPPYKYDHNCHLRPSFVLFWV